MDLPIVVKDLVNAQNTFDSTAFANCFAETANVFDEGRTHEGRNEIKTWIEKAGKEYSAVMKPLRFQENGNTGVLEAEVSGTFPGSPLVLYYNFEFDEKLISYLKINS